MAAMYKYQKLTELDAIRLIVLEPATSLDDPLHCDLRTTSLSQCRNDLIEKYTALSYVWEAPNCTSLVTIDGKAFYITASLDSALRHLRDTTRKRQIWADAICINQNDIGERNQQVNQMGSVYATADHTVIYLGEGTAGTDRMLQNIHNEVPIPIRRLESDASALEFLLMRPWFKRVWVLQELVLSRDPWIQCGAYLVRWNDFRQYLGQGELSQDIEKLFYEMDNLRTEHARSLISPTNSRT